MRNMKKEIIAKLMLCFLCLYSAIDGYASEKINVQVDRWMEIDLYWFDRQNMKQSVDIFWERYYPLMKNVSGYKGVILNIGWLPQYILEWNGDLNTEITLPKEIRTYPWFKDKGALTGNSESQRQLGIHRFATAENPLFVKYEKWTYGDLKKLVAQIKRVAKKSYRLEDVKVGSLVYGAPSIYGSAKMTFQKKHPDVFCPYFNMVGKLEKDDTRYGAYPEGIPEGTLLTEFFGKQWGHLSQAVELDAIVLRDGFLGVTMYRRTGPYGQMAPNDVQKAKAWSEGTANLVRQTKMANPKALVIGYSNATSAIGDWRANCMDLEKIANEGYLDCWIDQTWAGAWNEIGQRPGGGFWNRQDIGWSYQLDYVLGHAALLANSKVRHYILTETYDAWESWNVIHCARERLKWGIWAYSHATVKTPDGLKMPAGNYISWMNKGKDLLSEADVDFLTENSDAAFADARQTTEVMGPTLVYCRSAMEWMMNHQPDQNIKEWIDEQAGSLSKWSIPILSITRSEYLPQVESDLFVFQTPIHLQDTEKTEICKLLNSGKPVAVWGSPAGGVDPEILKILGVSTSQERISDYRFIGTLDGKTEGIYEDIPNTFALYQLFSKNQCNEEVEVIYTVYDSPTLVYNNTHGKRTIFWDPPELACNTPNGPRLGKPVDVLLGSPAPYVITARLFNEMLKATGKFYVDQVKQYTPTHLLYWKNKDDSYYVLAGNLEEGINHKMDQSVDVVVNIPAECVDQISGLVENVWKVSSLVVSKGKLPISLNKGESALFKMKK